MSFTDGLDGNALRWVRENQREGSLLLQRGTLRPSTAITGSATRTGSGFGLPPPSKFRSGHLPRTAIPLSATRPVLSSSESDNDVTEESDEGDVYGAGGGGRYSLDSSPHDGRSSAYSSARYGSGMKSGPRYGSDYGFSDVSSSMETLAVSAGRGRQGNVAAARGFAKNGRYAAGRNGYTEDDCEDDDDDDVDDEVEDGSVSAGSSEFSTSQVGSVSSALPRSTLRDSEGYASSVPRRANVEAVSASKVSQPSAPPFSASTQEIRVDTKEAPETCKAAGNEDPLGISMSNDASKSKIMSGVDYQDNLRTKSSERSVRSATSIAEAATSGSNPARVPTFHASALGPWHSVIAYDGCVRVCLNAWAKGCMEAPEFLNDECALLRQAFGIQHVLLQSEEELMDKRSSEVSGEAAAPKPKKIVGKMKVQVRRVKTVLDPPTGCNMSSLVLRAPKLKIESVRYRFSKFQSTLFAAWRAFRRIHVAPRVPTKGSFSRQSLAYVHASTQYIKKVSGLLKIGVTSLRDNSASYEAVQEAYCCLLRMKSSMEEDTVRMQPGSGETHVFFPDSLGDDLVVEVLDLKGKYYGRVVAQVATIAEDPVDKLHWWSIYREPEHEIVGKLQLYINYSTSSDDSGLKCGSVAETVAYDLVLEVAMKIQGFQQRKLLLDNPWKWLLNEFAQYYGVSDVYRKLRYLSYIMDVATPTADCLTLVYDLLEPVIMRSQSKSMFSHQENRILGEIKDQIEQILCLVFENYKSLDESLLSGIMDVFKPATGVAPPALQPAVKLYVLLHDIFSPEAQTNLTQYFQAAARKRSRRHLSETDEFVTGSNEATLLDSVATSTAYQKMTSLCMNIKNEIHTDIEIHNQDILPSFIDLPNLSSSIYSSELCSRLRAFLLACPPSGPSAHVRELVIATSDFQRDLASWKISPIKGGVDAKELFHLYIMLWIQDKRLSLLESCKLDKVKWLGVRTQHCTTPFVDEMYERLKETLDDYEVIICRWPEYIFVLENAIADVEKAVVEALDKQYVDVLAPLKESMQPRKFGFNYVKKLTKRTVSSYKVPDELGILLNSMKRMLDVLHPKIEARFKSWGSCIPTSGNVAPGERLSEVAVMLRAKFRGYQQAVVEKLGENTKLQNATKLKKILQDSKESVTESEIRNRMQPLKEQLTNTITHLHSAFEIHVFIAICRGYWDRMGQDVLSFLENRKENRSWYKGSQVAVSVLDDTFASQMQQLIGNALQAKELEPPTSIMEVHSMLCKDAGNQKNKNYYY